MSHSQKTSQTFDRYDCMKAMPFSPGLLVLAM